MEITVVGSGTVVPRLERRQSCVAIKTESETIVLDLGSGAVRGMIHAGLDPFSVDRIFLTHFHPDHTSDLIPLLFAFKYGSSTPRSRVLNIAGPKPFEKFWDSILRVWGDWLAGDYPMEISELPRNCKEPLDLTGYRLSWGPARHRPESIAYRFESENEAFVYTGDTEYSESVVELARGAHTLLIECSAPDNVPIPGHLTPSAVARIAREAGVRRAILTHIYPEVEKLDLISEVGKDFGGEVVVAHDGLAFTV